MELTKSEMEIMDVLWASAKPLSRSDLLERSEEKTWKDSSVHILLNGLLQKKAIREAGVVKRSKTYGRTFEPTLTREEYFATTIFSHRHKPEIVGLFAEQCNYLICHKLYAVRECGIFIRLHASRVSKPRFACFPVFLVPWPHFVFGNKFLDRFRRWACMITCF